MSKMRISDEPIGSPRGIASITRISPILRRARSAKTTSERNPPNVASGGSGVQSVYEASCTLVPLPSERRFPQFSQLLRFSRPPCSAAEGGHRSPHAAAGVESAARRFLCRPLIASHRTKRGPTHRPGARGGRSAIVSVLLPLRSADVTARKSARRQRVARERGTVLMSFSLTTQHPRATTSKAPRTPHVRI